MSKAMAQESGHPDLGLLLILFQVVILLLKSSVLQEASTSRLGALLMKGQIILFGDHLRVLHVSVENWEIVIHKISFQPSLNSVLRSKKLLFTAHTKFGYTTRA